MIYPNVNNSKSELSENHIDLVACPGTGLENLRVDCKKCSGLCCIALYFSASEGFPIDKDAGVPCLNLQSDFSCSVHKTLRKQGLKGCTAYDCFGAGQKVTQVTYGGQDWRQIPESSKEIFEVFLIMRQLHEMIWYLTEALTLQPSRPIHNEINIILKEIESLTYLSADSLIVLDVEAYRTNVNALLLHTSELVRNKFRGSQKTSSRHSNNSARGSDFFGADLRKTNLRGANLRGACLIAANLSGNDLSGADLIGADLRDTDLRGTNLIDSIFLTQAQVNTAKGDLNTRLPMSLTRPTYWSK